MNDLHYMQLALNLAKETQGQTSPNPVVGAVLVKNNQIIGLGTHLKAGEAHAEVIAIDMAKEKSKNATLYVTLEPCSHVGRTQACADYIVQNNIARVVVAMLDPNEKVSGLGIEKIREAGIEVELGLLADEAKEINQHYLTSMLNQRPYITLKHAISLDGKIATSIGESKWITSKEARIDVHKDRSLHDSILVGINTVLADNPSLTIRHIQTHKQPIRLILDTHLKTPLTSKIITDGLSQTWLFVSDKVDKLLIEKYESFDNVTVYQLKSSQVKLENVLDILHKKEIRSVYVEGGAHINDSFLQKGLIDEVNTYIAPMLIGGAKSPTSFQGKGIKHLKDAFQLELKSVKQIGKDIKIISQKEGQRCSQESLKKKV
ncbi:MAG TPA: bifunctional diaminohydroxyphosphoribosylaminopyrimidine deaminase/5-amino-6-(5-phosphoribosylamino)uracil reductase RibD [Pseudogracilibacillus sp.]|nr:bifunctional diaminohydroxyphosphoribosylaminopyrimidine deaminase/5-amino-6-(5-phosphoribosylamino)uracil reductase RibD [Pseudogracilibacillus sp.]